jgi:ornithine carbamoyltransferase
MSIADLTPSEFTALVRNAATHKATIKSNRDSFPLRTALQGQTVGLVFNKRSTRTRISTEGAIAAMGGQPMFLGKDDIQLGVNESLRDTSIVMSSMMSGLIARVGAHSEITGLAEYSSVPIINALSENFHPFQAVADFLTVTEAVPRSKGPGLGLEGLKIAWVGDANNVLFDWAIGAVKLGANISVASPTGYGIPAEMRKLIKEAAVQGGTLTETTVPEEAVKDASIIVTDTFISMGQEEETAQRLKAFQGFQVTNDMAKRGGALADWKFMHCLPRHPGEYSEVDDDVFYGPRSLVFTEAENRLWAAISVLEGFLVNKGKIV